MPRLSTDPVAIDPDAGWRETVPALREGRYSQTLERGFEILTCFTPERPVRGIADISDELGMKRSTTHRYVSTLAALGYLKQGAKRKYMLDLGVCELGMAALNGTSLREHAREYLEQLRRQTLFTVSLVVLDGLEVMYVDRAPGGHPGQHQIALGLAPGARQPPHCTAAGKLLIAYLPKATQREVIRELKLAKYAPNTITGKRALQDELAQIQTEGLAIAYEELAPGLYAIAAPVRCESYEVVAAVSIAAHSSMIPLEHLVEHLGPHLVSTADRISARLGYRRDDERPRSR
jgi:IclR family transcriptional regulator, pca regulon regulatory protein